MSRNKSVEKGNRFERELAEELTRWSGVPLRKTPRDGDWAKAMYPGDVIPTIALDRMGWPFSIEAKDVKNYDLDHAIRGRKTGFTELIDNAYDRRVDRFPILIARRSRMKPVVFTPTLPGTNCSLLLFHRIWWRAIPLSDFVQIPFEVMRDVASSAISHGKHLQIGNHPAEAIQLIVGNG